MEIVGKQEFLKAVCAHMEWSELTSYSKDQTVVDFIQDISISQKVMGQIVKTKTENVYKLSK